jgi:hypothetical protein
VRHGAWRRGGHARAEGERKGGEAWRDPYHPGVLRRRLGAEDWRRQGEIVAAQGRRCPRVELQHGSARAQGELGKAEALEGGAGSSCG